MGSAEEKFPLGTRFLVHEILEKVTNEVSEIVVETCKAEGIAIWLDEIGSASVDSTLAGGGKFQLAHELRMFLEAKCNDETFTHGGGLDHRNIDPVGEVVFVMLPLNGQAQQIGCMAVAVAAENWTELKVFETCAKVASLAATVLESGRSRQQLEIELAEADKRLNRLARSTEIEPLTKVENKASFEKKARERLGNRESPAAMLAMDLDHFKQVNDVYGHQFGDEYLMAIAEAIKISFPRTAIIGRTGGDEFCAVLDIPQAGRSYLDSVIQHVRLAISRSVAVMGRPDLGRVSIGVSLFPVQATSYEQLMGLADRALYASKRMERNTTTVYNNSLSALMEMADDRKGPAQLNYERITAHFQPVFNMSTGGRDGVEVLARWTDRDGTTQNPESFGWMFRDHRYAARLTLHIVEIALNQLAGEGRSGNGDMPDLWINVTDYDLRSREFVFDLQSVLTLYGVGWDRIVIEVSEESMLGERNGSIFNSLQEIRHRGGRVALDDFGTGYAGLMHVSHWPVDIIKIDRSFVQDVATDPGARVVVEALVMIANTLDQQVVAEGIETDAQLSTMSALGCDYAQGFFLARPVPAQSLEHSPLQIDFAQPT